MLSTPRIIDLVYIAGLQKNDPNTVLTAGDRLAYYGTLLAMLGAIFGVIIIIDYSRKNYHEDVLNRVMPFIAVKGRHVKFRSSFLDGLEDKGEEPSCSIDNEFSEYPIESAYLLITAGRIEFVTILSADQKRLIEHTAEMNYPDNPRASNYYSYDLINVGIGTAVDCTIMVREASEDAWYPSPLMTSLLPNQSIKMGMYVETQNDESDRAYTKYHIRINYSNIYGDYYTQERAIEVFNEGCIEEVIERQRRN